MKRKCCCKTQMTKKLDRDTVRKTEGERDRMRQRKREREGDTHTEIQLKL